MKFSYNWLQEYFEQPLPEPERLGEILTFHAFEVESIEKAGKDTVIDIDILPNRSSDCLSHRGIAREIATLLSKNLKYDPLDEEVLEVDESEVLSVEIIDTKLCDRYAAVVIKDLKIGPSPDWLKERLEALGQRSINNVVDATNYVMQNTGQPLHAFDFDKLEGNTKKIVVRAAKEGEKITTLTDDEYELDASALLITDGHSETPIALAGIKGGNHADVDEKTINIVLESAHFDFASTRKTAQKVKLWTDASIRFQNNPSQHLVGYALADVVELILDIAGGKAEGAFEVVEPQEEAPEVIVSAKQINALIGTNLKVEEVQSILDRLGFEHSCENDTFVVIAPFERTDITIAEDVIEEVGRVYGYEKLESKQLPDVGLKPKVHKEFYYADKVRNILNDAGYSEIYGYSFTDKGDHEAVAALASDKSFLRTNLASGMKEYLEMNAHNAPLFGKDRITIFEIGTVFPKDNEHRELVIAVSGKKTDKILNEVKEVLQEKLGASVSENPKEGMLEIDFTKLIESLPESTEYEPFEKNNVVYKQFSSYPFVTRDIALWVPESISEDELTEMISKDAGDLLVRIDQFDRFEKEGRVSYAFHLVFQSMDRTLTDEEIGVIMDTITNTLNTQETFEVR